MRRTQDEKFDAALAAIPSIPDPLGDIPLYEDTGNLEAWDKPGKARKRVWGLLQGAGACACGAGASHVACAAIPAVTAFASGGALGGIGAALSSGAAMYGLSPVFAIAVNTGIDRYRGVRRTVQGHMKSMVVSAVPAVMVTALVNFFTGHEHIDNSRKQYLGSLPPAMRAAEMVVPQQRYGRLPQSLQLRVNEAARREGLSPAEYLYFCDGSDELGRDLLAYERALRGDQGRQLAP